MLSLSSKKKVQLDDIQHWDFVSYYLPLTQFKFADTPECHRRQCCSYSAFAKLC